MALSHEQRLDLIDRKREAYIPQKPMYVLFSQEDALSVTPGFSILMGHEIQQGRLTDRTSVTMTPFEQMFRSINIAAARDAGHTVSLTQAGIELLGLMVDTYYAEKGVEKNTPIPPNMKEVMTSYINFKGVYDRVSQKTTQSKRRSIMSLILRKK